MHQHEVAQGFIERCQARSTDLSGVLPANRIDRSNLCDYPGATRRGVARQVIVHVAGGGRGFIVNTKKLQAQYQNRAAGGEG